MNNLSIAEAREDCGCQNLDHKAPLSRIQDKAAEGCKYCSIIWSSISSLSVRDENTRAELIAGSYVQFNEGHVAVFWQDGQTEYFRLFTTQDVEGCNAIVRRNQVTTAGSHLFFALIGEWIEDCNTNHSFCRTLSNQSSSSPNMPARLIRIEKDCERPGGHRVFLQENPKDSTKYIALSHCWGLHQPLTTTKDTIAARRAGIDWESLPKTFQDAIIICAGLDVNYIWIDSLCILQDDKNDWGVESAKMSTIYKNAWLTIAAAAAPDATHGCFPTSLPVIKYELQMPNESIPTTVFARKLLSPIDSRDHLLKPISNLPLFQRAWVFQERLLSRRILYLCEDEMAFECATNIRCECSGPVVKEAVQTVDGVEYFGIKYRYNSLLNSWSWHKSLGNLLPFQPTSILNVWDHFVSQFTKRHLTYDKDRLPALSGIANMMHSTGALGRYYSGLWEARLAEGLLWFVNPTNEGFDPLPPTIGTPTAPSWSWASINGSWDYQRISLERTSLYGTGEDLYVTDAGLELSAIGFACKDLEIELHLASPDFFGGIELGKITLTAPLTPAVISYEPSGEDERYAIRLRDQKVRLVKGELVAEPFMDFVLDYGESLIPQDLDVFCVGILPEYNRGKRNVHSLVLLLAEHKGEKVYRRFGKFLAPDGWYERVGLQKLTIV